MSINDIVGEVMMMARSYGVLNLRCLLIVITVIACLALTKLAVAESCNYDQVSIPDADTLVSVQSRVKEGDALAQAQLGRAYLHGYGVEQDIAKALMLLKKSADAGDREGQYWLGKYYVISGKTNKKFIKAARLLQQSSDQGCIPAMFYLGLIITNGKGIPKDAENGLRLITKTAEAGYPKAQLWLGTIIINGEGIKKDISAGFNWIKRAAEDGYSPAEIALADLYLIGKGTQSNPEKAISLLESVYAKKDEHAPVAAYSLAWIYMEGKGVPVDTIKSFRFMIIAANAEISDSEQRLKTLTEQLPKQKLVTECSVYMDSLYATNDAKEYTHISIGSGETVAVLSSHANFYEVYFPDRPMVGFIPLHCLDSEN